MADLMELAALVETAEGPDRELDGEIAFLAAGYGRYHDEPECLWKDGERYSLREPDYYELSGQIRELPHFTASLDAAMTLVPEGWKGQIQFGLPGAWVAPVGEVNPADFNSAATPALALCAAALCARAATHDDKGKAHG